MVVFADLKREHESEVIGSLILEEVRLVARQIVKGYDPKIYGQAESWDDAIDDLVQDVVVQRLIGEGQIDYAMLVSTDMDHFRRLVNKQTKRTLAGRRSRTVIDNLLSRLKSIAGEPPWERVDTNGRWRYHPAADASVISDVDDVRLYAAARDVALIPRTKSRSDERAPIVYTTQSLEQLLLTVSSRIAGSVSVDMLDQILRKVLTSFLPSFLGASEEQDYSDAAVLGPDEQLACESAVADVLGRLDSTQRKVLRMKLAGISDGEVASTIGVSRPTAADRKNEAMSALGAVLQEVAEPMHLALLDGLVMELLREEAQGE